MISLQPLFHVVAVGETEDKLMVTFSNYGVESVWQTTDGGETWASIEANLPDMPVRWALYHPDNDGQALLATEIGVWSTNMLNQAEVEWDSDVEGMANVRVDMLRIRQVDNTVIAATHGRGCFTSVYPMNPFYSVPENNSSQTTLSIYPNPATDIISISSHKGGSLRILDMSGRMVVEKENISDNQTIDVSDLPNGVICGEC